MLERVDLVMQRQMLGVGLDIGWRTRKKRGCGKMLMQLFGHFEKKDPPFTRIKIPKRDQTKAQEGLGIAMAHDLQLEED